MLWITLLSMRQIDVEMMVVAGGCEANVAAASWQAKTVEVPSGTKVLLELRSAVNTKTAKPGDGVYLSSSFPVVVNGQVAIPAGVYVQGVIDQVTRPGRVKGRAAVRMHFSSIIFPNGSVVEIPGIVNSMPGAKKQTVKGDGEGTIVSTRGRVCSPKPTAMLQVKGGPPKA